MSENKLTTEQLKRQAIFKISVFFAIVITLGIFLSGLGDGGY
jgi:capsule polysaccharide export protein KpsE/RkpR